MTVVESMNGFAGVPVPTFVHGAPAQDAVSQTPPANPTVRRWSWRVKTPDSESVPSTNAIEWSAASVVTSSGEIDPPFGGVESAVTL